jgi:hypothetical protein
VLARQALHHLGHAFIPNLAFKKKKYKEFLFLMMKIF